MRSAAGRVLGLAVVAVLVMSVVGLAATQTFINRTGKTVIGIKITFSKSVSITRHDSVFPDQSPDGRSQEFTFSGGNLHNFGRFSIAWLPSSGKVTHYEWIEKVQPAQQSQEAPASSEQEFKLPDPNTPPILYGNDYPGPNEPLYEPKPDEQIWLTDLDGHGDIYDNDSIKINYAPGFDKSQITKIDVYRNGTKLRFLPEKFDVLTNAQMKTFDGNPAERSPASNHTDHAIMGYEYKFEIHTADDLWIQTKTVKSGFRWRPKEVWAEMDDKWADALRRLTKEDVKQFFAQLKEDGFTGISIDMAYYMDTPYSNDVFEMETVDSRIAIWDIRTPSVSELETMLKLITGTGLDVHIRGVIYISKQYNDSHGGIMRMGVFAEPSDPAAFFDSYTKLWLKLAPVMDKYSVRLATPFTEMDGIEKYIDLIKAMYSRLSNEYTGELGFEEATHNMILGESVLSGEPPHQKAFEEIAGQFWDWADAHGRQMVREYSCWVIPMDTIKDQRASVMRDNFVKFWRRATDYYRLRYPNNAEMFGEMGVYDADGVCLGQAYWDIEDRIYDDEETADGWYAYLRGSSELGIDMVNVWSLPLGDLYGNWIPEVGFLNIGLRQPKSSAYRVITSIIKPEE